MILQEIKSLNPRLVDLRNFGLLVGAVFCAIGFWCWARQKPIFLWLLAAGVLLLTVGLVRPGWLRAVYYCWMSLAIFLGFFVSNLLLLLLFFLVITPIGLLSRIAGKDFLRQRLDRTEGSCWIARPPTRRSKADYEKQY